MWRFLWGTVGAHTLSSRPQCCYCAPLEDEGVCVSVWVCGGSVYYCLYKLEHTRDQNQDLLCWPLSCFFKKKKVVSSPQSCPTSTGLLLSLPFNVIPSLFSFPFFSKILVCISLFNLDHLKMCLCYIKRRKLSSKLPRVGTECCVAFIHSFG